MRWISLLETSGLVNQRIESSNRRRTLIKLTEIGWSTVARLLSHSAFCCACPKSSGQKCPSHFHDFDNGYRAGAPDLNRAASLPVNKPQKTGNSTFIQQSTIAVAPPSASRRGRRPRGIVEFPAAITDDRADPAEFHLALALQMARHQDTSSHLQKARACAGQKIESSTLRQWSEGYSRSLCRGNGCLAPVANPLPYGPPANCDGPG